MPYKLTFDKIEQKEKIKEAVTGVTGKRIFTDHWV
jgi:hypothetical protein